MEVYVKKLIWPLLVLFLVSCDSDDQIEFPNGTYKTSCINEDGDGASLEAVRDGNNIVTTADYYIGDPTCSGPISSTIDVGNITFKFSNTDLGGGVSYIEEYDVVEGEEELVSYTPFFYDAPNLYIGETVDVSELQTGQEPNFIEIFALFIADPVNNADFATVKQ
jgi:hypothetical protein